MISAQCHPERQHRAFGLCERCYDARRRRAKGIPEKFPRPEFADCHPDQPTHARRMCSTCYSAAVNPQRKREALLRTWGLTPEAFDELLASQGGVCAICKRTEPGGTGRWHVDHDHSTGVIRGLLCARCNRGLGLLGDDPAVLEAAHAYLEGTALRRSA